MIGSKPRLEPNLQGAELQAFQANYEEPWKQRVLLEKSELNDKIGKLAAFLSSEQFEALPEAEQDRLTRQLDAMTVYRSILTERITAWDAPPVTDSVTDTVSEVTDSAVSEIPEPGTV